MSMDIHDYLDNNGTFLEDLRQLVDALEDQNEHISILAEEQDNRIESLESQLEEKNEQLRVLGDKP
jgi:DNA-binding transcriptional MerR regulator